MRLIGFVSHWFVYSLINILLCIFNILPRKSKLSCWIRTALCLISNKWSKKINQKYPELESLNKILTVSFKIKNIVFLIICRTYFLRYPFQEWSPKRSKGKKRLTMKSMPLPYQKFLVDDWSTSYWDPYSWDKILDWTSNYCQQMTRYLSIKIYLDEETFGPFIWILYWVIDVEDKIWNINCMEY